MRAPAKILGVFTILLFCLSANGQGADAVIDRNEISIGEQAVISLSYRIQKNGTQVISFPEVGDTLLANVEVVKRTPVDTLNTGEAVSETRLEQKLYITSFDSGYYAIPPFEFTVDGKPEKTGAFLLTVKTVEIDTTAGILPEKEIYTVDVTIMDYVKVYWPYAAAGIGLLALAAILFIAVRRYRKKQRSKPVVVVEEPLKPAHILALEALESIRREKIYAQGKVKEYHTSITDVLRDYLERAFNIAAHELTSRQIMDRLRYAGIDEKHLLQLRTILFRADMVKFAKEKPGEDENALAVQDAMHFVKATKPAEVLTEPTYHA